MEKLKILFTFLTILFFYACSHKSAVRQTGDKDLTLQLVNISDRKVKGDISYAARIIPGKGKYSSAGKSLKESLMYRMDSCFYLEAGKQKVYSQLTQPVANGLSGAFEYLVTFDIDNFDEHKWNFVYQDKYLNQKRYTLKLAD